MANKTKVDESGETTLTCGKCGGTTFRFTWKWKNEEQRNKMYMMHDGLGYLAEDAYMICDSCGKVTEPENKYDW